MSIFEKFIASEESKVDAEAKAKHEQCLEDAKKELGYVFALIKQNFPEFYSMVGEQLEKAEPYYFLWELPAGPTITQVPRVVQCNGVVSQGIAVTACKTPAKKNTIVVTANDKFVGSIDLSTEVNKNFSLAQLLKQAKQVVDNARFADDVDASSSYDAIPLDAVH